MNANDGRYEDLLAELRLAGVVLDPVPERVTSAAKASFTWRTVDAELASLTYDSALDADRLAFVRGTAAARQLTFSASGLTVDIEAEETDGSLRLIGELAPAQRAVITVRHNEGTTEVETDEDGRFRTGPIPTGPVALSLRLAAGGSAVQTEWITL
jgi:hypothetical protein